MPQHEILSVYKLIRQKLKEECDNEGCVNYQQIKTRFKNFRINKKLFGVIIIELERFGYIERIGQSNGAINHRVKFIVK